MKSHALPSFWRQFAKLSPDVQRRANQSYHLWRTNPFASSLRFKRVSEQEPIYSVRIGRSHRALGLMEGNVIYWYFIGDHDEYERELKNL